jgi:predicted PurR-regulated permease PerM
MMAVGMFGATVALLGVLAASRRVIGWIMVAATLAALLHPLVTLLQRRMRRGLAVAIVMLGFVASAAVVGYGIVDDIRVQTRRLEQVAPARAQELERSERFGQLARDFRAAERTRQFIDDLPARLRGGTPAEALRAAATRGVAFLATGVLTVFLLLHGPRIVQGAIDQASDPRRRARLNELYPVVYARAFGYAGSTLCTAVAAGLFGFLAARVADVPAPAPLAVWMGLWDLVPVGGALVGALPIVGLAAVRSSKEAIGLAAVFIAYQVMENLVIQRRIESSTVRVGPFLTLMAGLVGLELSGMAGALLAVLAATIAVAVTDEVTSP